MTPQQKDRVRNAVRAAISKGLIARPQLCSRCRRAEKIEAHHRNGYEDKHALEIEFLCIRCHRSLHRGSCNRVDIVPTLIRMTPDQVRALRQRLGLTQVELAGRLEVDKMTVSRWERGVVPIPKATAELLKLWAKQKGRRR